MVEDSPTRHDLPQPFMLIGILRLRKRILIPAFALCRWDNQTDNDPMKRENSQELKTKHYLNKKKELKAYLNEAIEELDKNNESSISIHWAYWRARVGLRLFALSGYPDVFRNYLNNEYDIAFPCEGFSDISTDETELMSEIMRHDKIR